MGYFKDIDLNNDEAVLKFLKGHDAYIINGDIIPYTCYSNNIKIYNLDVTDEEKYKLYGLLALDEPSFDIRMVFEMLNEEFNKKTSWILCHSKRKIRWIPCAKFRQY